MSKTKAGLGMSIAIGLLGAACETEYKGVPGVGADTGGTSDGTGGSPGGIGTGGNAGTPVVAGPAGGIPGSMPGGASGVVGSGGGVVQPGAGGTVVMPGAGGTVVMPGAGGSATVAGSGGMEIGAGGAVVMPVRCPDAVMAPGTTSATVQVGSTSRQYSLHVPTGYTGKTPVPLVTDWHPILTNNAFEQGNSGYLQKSDTEGFVVAWPNGIDNAWNVGPCCTTSRSVDDVGFARALVAKLSTQLCIDPKRIYAVGYSMGGGMSYKLACDAADLFAAVAPAAFELMEDNEWPCKPSRPITVMSFNGTADFIVPYAGGASTPPNGLPITNHFLGVEATFKKWAMLDGCTDQPVDKGGGCKTYSQCQAGVEVTSCVKQGGGHEKADPNVAWATLKRFTLP
jgi:polyhydroxybutyrate depolymerase